MDIKKYKKLKEKIDKILTIAETDAQDAGVDVTSPEFDAVLEQMKERIVSQYGFDYEEYLAMEEEVSKPHPNEGMLLSMAKDIEDNNSGRAKSFKADMEKNTDWFNQQLGGLSAKIDTVKTELYSNVEEAKKYADKRMAEVQDGLTASIRNVQKNGEEKTAERIKHDAKYRADQERAFLENVEKLREEIFGVQSFNLDNFDEIRKLRKANEDLLPKDFTEKWELLTSGGLADELHKHDIRQRRGYGGVDAQTVQLMINQSISAEDFWNRSGTTLIPKNAGDSVLPSSDNSGALGSATVGWADLFLAATAVLDFGAGDVTITHATDSLAFAGAASGYTFSHALLPSANDGAAIGAITTGEWSDLFLASGGVINFAGGNATITHSTGLLSVNVRTNFTAGTVPLATSSTVGNANLGVYSAAATGTATQSQSIFAGASTVSLRVSIRGTTATITANNSYTSFLIGDNVITEASSGTHALLAQQVIKTLTVTNGTGATTNTAGLYIEGAPTGITPTGNAYGLWVDSGLSGFGGNIIPDANDGAALGVVATGEWSDLALASGAVITFANAFTITHSTNLLTFSHPISLGISNALTLGTIEIGHATDTTIARSGAGDITIEGNAVYRAGGTDVPLTDGGTGASTAAGARANLLTMFTMMYATQSLAAGPADATTYYFGFPWDVSINNTTADLRGQKVPFACVLRGASITVVATAGATTEAMTYSARINNTTDVQLSNAVTSDQASQQFTVTGLSTAIAAGDRIEIKVLTPTWVTNPTNFRTHVTLFFE